MKATILYEVFLSKNVSEGQCSEGRSELVESSSNR